MGRRERSVAPTTVGAVNASRFRCDACGNLTRFDVTVSQTTKAFHHFTVGGDLVVEMIGFACGQHYRCSGSQAPRQFDPDLTAAAQNQYRTCARVVHGCDYYLR